LSAETKKRLRPVKNQQERHASWPERLFVSFFRRRHACVLFLLWATQAQAADHLSIVLDWFINPNHAPILVAQQIGAYTAEGLDVELIQPADPSIGPKLVASGQADVALTAEPQFIEQVAAGLKLVRLGVLIDRPLSTLVALRGSGVARLADLRGKRIGYGSGEVEQVMVGVMLRHAGVSLADVHMVQIGEQLSVALLSHQVDAVSVYRNFEPLELERQGAGVLQFDYEKNGVPPFEDLMFASRPIPDGDTRYTRFLRATTRGLVYLRAHPAASWDMTRRMHPDLDNELNHAAWEATLPYFAADARETADYAGFAAFLRGAGLR
jgi:putative hydroxymethylpyrimidine transport system substrate-binding protein